MAAPWAIDAGWESGAGRQVLARVPHLRPLVCGGLDVLPGNVRRALVNRCGVPHGGRLLIAVSGGADSVALLHAMARQPRRFRAAHRVAHANHGLRGQESDGDEAFVRDLCNRLGIAVVTERLQIPVQGERAGESLEMCARKLRHRFLAAVARRYDLDAICLAHHGDDQIELFLMRLLRGAGGEGLQGMRWTGPSPADAGVRLVRPMLGCRRQELRGFLAAIGESYRDDSSNLDLGIPRNAIRHQLLPLLGKFGGDGVGDAILRAAELVGADADLTAKMADDWLGGGSRGPFRELHEAIQRVVIRRQLFALGQTPTLEIVEKLRGGASRAVIFPGGRRIVCAPDGILRSGPKGGSGPAVPTESEVLRIWIEGANGCQVLPDGRRLLWRVQPRPQGWAPESDGTERFDAASVGGVLNVRHWRPGDRFHSLGATGSSKLQDLFTNRKVPAPERRRRWLACAADGQIVWVEGLPPGDCFKVTGRSRHVLELSLERQGPLTNGD